MYPLASEAFITEQVAALRRFRPLLLTRSSAGPIGFDHFALSEARAGALRAAAFAVTHLPLLFAGEARLRDLCLLHAHFGPDGVSVAPLARRLGIPLIVTFHGGDCTVHRRRQARSGKLYNYHFLLGEPALKRQTALFLAVSDFIRRTLIGRGYPKDKVRTHYIGVDTSVFTPAAPAGGEPYVLCVARHVPKKGIDILLRAFASLARAHPSLSLAQVGTGPLSGSLRTLAAALGIDGRVRFLGAQPHQRIVALMQQAVAFALPSQMAADGDSEALGIVLNEASACGIPVAATLHGGIPEAVLDGETGFLVPEGDSSALADRLDRLVSDAGLARRMGQRGREYVCDTFDLRKQTGALERIYDEVAGA